MSMCRLLVGSIGGFEIESCLAICSVQRSINTDQSSRREELLVQSDKSNCNNSVMRPRAPTDDGEERLGSVA